MRLITATLAVALIALLPCQAQAYGENCFKPQEIHQALIQEGFMLYMSAYSDNGTVFGIYMRSDDSFIMLGESPTIACVLSQGVGLYVPKERNI